jgi:O-antigen ligase
VFLGFWHQYDLNYYEAFVPFLLAPMAFHGLMVSPIDQRALWFSASVGAFFACCLAAYQVFVLEIDRAVGGLKNAIIFGDLSIVFAAISLMGYVFAPKDLLSKAAKIILLLGFVFGIMASLLSGSKGGWMSIFTIVLVFVWFQFRHKSVWFRVFLFAVGSLLVVKLFLLAPTELVLGRIHHGLLAGAHWFQTGEVTDGSVSVRLELWRRGLLMVEENWLMGWSGSGLHENLSAQMASIGLPWFGGNLENDLLQTLVSLGLLGLMGKLALYGLIFLGFLQYRRHPELLIRGLSVLGGLLVLLYLEFGLSVIVLGHNSFRHVLVVFSLLFLCLLIKQNPNQKALP